MERELEIIEKQYKMWFFKKSYTEAKFAERGGTSQPCLQGGAEAYVNI